MPVEDLPRYFWARGFECVWMGFRICARTRRGGPARRSVAPGGGWLAAARRMWPVSGVAPGSVALTLDDGPDPRWTPAALDVLARHQVPATFFLIGARVAEHPGLTRRLIAEGHAIGNHSMHHPQPFAALSLPRLNAEIGAAQRQIEDSVGITPRLFRAPGGGWSPSVLRTLTAHGLTAVDWSLNPSDWKRPGTAHVTRRLSRGRPGDVLLCHDGGGDRSQTIEALDAVIPVLKRRGLAFVTLEPKTER